MWQVNNTYILQPMEEETDFSKAKRALQMADTGAGPIKKAGRAGKVDSNIPNSSQYTVSNVGGE